MNPADRIRALRDQGHLLPHEAQRLLDALDDTLEKTRHDTLEAVDRALPPHDDAPTPESTPSDVPRTWTTVHATACSLDIRVDATLHEPRLDVRQGDLTLERNDDGWHLHQGKPGDEPGRLSRFLKRLHHAKGTLTLPEGTGVHLDVTAGDLDLHGVPALTGRLHAGDVEARGLHAIDLKVHVGDVDIHLDPVPGNHRIHLSVGDLDVRLAHGADVTLHGHVDVGDAEAARPFHHERRGLIAAAIEGTSGSGTANLHASVGTGDLTIRNGEPHA